MKVFLQSYGNSFAHALLLLPSGKLVTAGGQPFALVRYTKSGFMDSTFGSGGWLPIEFTPRNGEAFAVISQPDGKLVAAGVNSTPGVFALARGLANGTLDPTFGDHGRVLTVFNVPLLPTECCQDSAARALLLQPEDQKVVVAGIARVYSAPHDRFSLALARYDPDGTLDVTFGTGGRVLTELPSLLEVRAIVLQPDGKLVVGGWRQYYNPEAEYEISYQVVLARYDTDGTLDSTFGDNGVVLTEFAPYQTAHALILQADGKLLVAGSGGVVRYHPDGSLDTGVGQNGRMLTPFMTSVEALLVQPDGKLVVAGSAW